MTTISTIDISSTCLESYPCQHYCTVTFSNGSQQKKLLDGWDLIKDEYWCFLSVGARKHFQYMKELATPQDAPLFHQDRSVGEKEQLTMMEEEDDSDDSL